MGEAHFYAISRQHHVAAAFFVSVAAQWIFIVDHGCQDATVVFLVSCLTTLLPPRLYDPDTSHVGSPTFHLVSVEVPEHLNALGFPMRRVVLMTRH